MEPQFLSRTQTIAKKASSVHFIAEADEHGLFEIRFHRLATLGDRENSDTFPSKQVAIDVAAETDTQRQVLQVEAIELFQRFASCSFYYNEVNKSTYNVCPAFYKYKIQPFQWLFESPKGNESDGSDSFETDYDSDFGGGSSNRSQNEQRNNLEAQLSYHGEQLKQKGTTLRRMDTHMESDLNKDYNQDIAEEKKQLNEWKKLSRARRLMRVYEVEEHMGDEFMEELSRLH